MNRKTIQREGEWTEIPEPVAFRCRRLLCAMCLNKYGVLTSTNGSIGRSEQILHHIFSRRFLKKRGLDPHCEKNLISICNRCHGTLRPAETKLFFGDACGFVTGYRQAHFPMFRVREAAAFYGLKEIGKFLLDSER